MVLKHFRGYTLIEIITVLAIVIVIVAITYPVLSNSKKSAFEQVTTNSLHQQWLTLELYRQDQGESAVEVGESSQLGLPNINQYFSLIMKQGITWWQKPGSLGY